MVSSIFVRKEDDAGAAVVLTETNPHNHHHHHHHHHHVVRRSIVPQVKNSEMNSKSNSSSNSSSNSNYNKEPNEGNKLVGDEDGLVLGGRAEGLEEGREEEGMREEEAAEWSKKKAMTTTTARSKKKKGRNALLERARAMAQRRESVQAEMKRLNISNTKTTLYPSLDENKPVHHRHPHQHNQHEAHELQRGQGHEAAPNHGPSEGKSYGGHYQIPFTAFGNRGITTGSLPPMLPPSMPPPAHAQTPTCNDPLHLLPRSNSPRPSAADAMSPLNASVDSTTGSISSVGDSDHRSSSSRTRAKKTRRERLERMFRRVRTATRRPTDASTRSAPAILSPPSPLPPMPTDVTVPSHLQTLPPPPLSPTPPSQPPPPPTLSSLSRRRRKKQKSTHDKIPSNSSPTKSSDDVPSTPTSVVKNLVKSAVGFSPTRSSKKKKKLSTLSYLKSIVAAERKASEQRLMAASPPLLPSSSPPRPAYAQTNDITTTPPTPDVTSPTKRLRLLADLQQQQQQPSQNKPHLAPTFLATPPSSRRNSLEPSNSPPLLSALPPKSNPQSNILSVPSQLSRKKLTLDHQFFLHTSNNTIADHAIPSSAPPPSRPKAALMSHVRLLGQSHPHGVASAAAAVATKKGQDKSSLEDSDSQQESEKDELESALPKDTRKFVKSESGDLTNDIAAAAAVIKTQKSVTKLEIRSLSPNGVAEAAAAFAAKKKLNAAHVESAADQTKEQSPNAIAPPDRNKFQNSQEEGAFVTPENEDLTSNAVAATEAAVADRKTLQNDSGADPEGGIAAAAALAARKKIEMTGNEEPPSDGIAAAAAMAARNKIKNSDTGGEPVGIAAAAAMAARKKIETAETERHLDGVAAMKKKEVHVEESSPRGSDIAAATAMATRNKDVILEKEQPQNGIAAAAAMAARKRSNALSDTEESSLSGGDIAAMVDRKKAGDLGCT